MHGEQQAPVARSATQIEALQSQLSDLEREANKEKAKSAALEHSCQQEEADLEARRKRQQDLAEEIERQSEGHRPYESYSTEDIQALRAAFESELAGSEARFEAVKRQRSRPKGDLGSVSANVAQFAQTAQTSRVIRRAAADVAEQQNEIGELDRELMRRANLREGLMRHVRRLTTI